MKPLFHVRCSVDIALMLGAVPLRRINRPDLSFPVYERLSYPHAELDTEVGIFAWLWRSAIHHTAHPLR